MVVHLLHAVDVLRCDDRGLSRALLGDDAAEMNDAVADDDVQPERAPIVLLHGIDDAAANVIVVRGRVGSGTSRARSATAWSRFARDTMPTILSPRITGRRFTLFRSMRSTISASAVSSVMVSGEEVITSETLRPCSWTKSLADLPDPRMNRSQRPRLRPVPISLRRMKSPSETTPTSLPALSTTVRPLICRFSMMFAASTMLVSGVTEMTDRVMI